MSNSRGNLSFIMKTYTNGCFRSLRSTRSTADDTIGGALEPTAPRALWRLIQIGETAGLVTPADQDAIVDAFGNADRRRESIDRALAHSRCSVTELYILVTLFAAEPRPVSVQTLARETLANSGSLRFALERLEALATISREVGAIGDSPIILTSSGRALSVILMYSVLSVVVSPTPPAQ